MAAIISLHPDLDALLRPAEVAAIFRVSPKTISRWSDAGVLASTRTNGGHRRFPARAVYELFDAVGVVGER